MSDGEPVQSGADKATRWWNREWFRQVAACPPAMFGLLAPGQTVVKVLAVWDLFAAIYLLLTWLTYRRRNASALRAIALASRRQTRVERMVTTPPEKFPQYAAILALVATAIVMPRAQALSPSPLLVFGICIVAVLTSWLILQVGFAIAYLGMFFGSGGLIFPGDDEPHIVDFLYFSVSVGTGFGTASATVSSRRVRRQILTHTVLAFAFNTLIIAAAVAIVTASISA